MDGGEIEMSREELQRWIRDMVKETQLVSPDVLEKCSQLQSLLQKREEQAANLLKLCESVAACEENVKKLYSMLGWEYRDTDSDDDDHHHDADPGDDDDNNRASCGHASPLYCESVHSETQVCRPLTSDGPAPLLSKLKDNDNPKRDLRKKGPLTLMREAVVVLTRLPASQITRAPPSPSPENHCMKDESLSSAESDMQWEPDGDSSDSDFCVSSTKKRKKTNQKNEKCVKSQTTHQTSINSIANSMGAKTLTPTASAESSAKSSSAPQARATTDTKSKTAKSPQDDTNASTENKAGKTSTSAASTRGVTPVATASAVTQSSATKTPPTVLQGEISVNMKVLARRRPLSWQRGTIVEITTKEDGRLKYKVSFEEKGKSLVSGHHIAFDYMPKVHQLFIGARVVVNQDNQFLPGVLAEVPSRKNRMRFLVFIDDHTPVYVGLPVIHLVCKPLQNPLDDILDEKHRNFMQNYVKRWPYPAQTQYKVGQTVNIECNGYLQRTNVLQIDCSLMQVVFLNNEHKEWLYRGSMRLEQMIVKENLESPNEDRKSKTTSVNESSKSSN